MRPAQPSQEHAEFVEQESCHAYLALALLSTVVHAALLAYDWALGGRQNLLTLVLALTASLTLAVIVRLRTP